MSKAEKIPFKISARTARLIGRQNFPNSDGAVNELVKNSYDADASICIIYFDNRFARFPETLSIDEYNKFSKEEALIAKYYLLNPSVREYAFSSEDTKSESAIFEMGLLQSYFQLKTRVYIMDNGEGMTNKIIEDFWMTIGTNNKELDVYTSKKRVKTGEKGIGRFALDKLGDSAEMLTKPDTKVHKTAKHDDAYLWQVDWNEFDGGGKTLDQVEANLINIGSIDFSAEVDKVLHENARTLVGNKLKSFKTGTKIEISNLRDEWNEYLTDRLFQNLEVLIPPREERKFDIFLFSTLNPQKYGRVSPSICDDYDYKVEANVYKDGIVKITIYRNEFEVKLIPDDFFDKDILVGKKYSKSNFKKGSYSLDLKVSELIPGLKAVDDKGVLSGIGEFDAVFYFLKATTSRDDSEVFLYKPFNSAARKKWLDQFGGIKLFRDNFRVRPYGEVKNAAFDWLQLGERASRSPNSIGQQRAEPWKVRPNQISGVINISRIANISFEDTSSRYGLQENETFRYFIQIVLAILEVFERDRSDVGRALRAYHDSLNRDIITGDKADEIKKRVRKSKSKAEKSQSEADSVILLDYAENLENKIEELKSETNLLRILASNSLVIATFTHELMNIKENLVFRIDEVVERITPLVNKQHLEGIPEFLNPFVMLESIRHDDEKLQEWLMYSFETLRRDKRFRKNIDLVGYFSRFKEFWRVACSRRGVELVLDLPKINDLKIRVFEAELDSIFNNLLINSIEAFTRKGAPAEREIKIKVERSEYDVHFLYLDSGPGLDPDIVNPEDIFKPHVTTKVDPFTGEKTGTGLGMWIVKSFVDNYNGSIEVLEVTSGFGVLIKFREVIRL